MTKLNFLPQSLSRPSAAVLDETIHPISHEQPRHLIILVPANMDCTTVTRRICRLANETNSSVQLLGLYNDTGEELALRRELVTVAALIRDAKVFVEICMEKGTNWVDAIKQNYQTGDILVCISEQSIGIRKKPLSQILESNFDAPVLLLSGDRPQKSRSNIVTQTIAWSGLIAIVAGFFILQVKITQSTNGGFQALLLILLLPPEIWLVQAWNSLFF